MGDFIFTVGPGTFAAWADGGGDKGKRIELLKEFEGPDPLSPEGKEIFTSFLSSIRSGLDKGIPSVDLILPSMEIFVRTVEFPFADIQKARLAAPALLAGSLPFEGEFSLDLVPLREGGEGESYLAFIVREEDISKVEAMVREAGFKCGQIVPAFIPLLAYAREKRTFKGIEYRDTTISLKAPTGWDEKGLVRILPPPGKESLEEGPFEKHVAVLNLSEKRIEEREEWPSHFSLVGDTLLESFVQDPLLSKFSLIAGKTIRQKEGEEKERKRNLLGASALLIALSLIFSLSGTSYFTMKKAKSLRGLMAKEFKEVFKGAVMVDPIAQMKEKIALIKGEIALFPSSQASFSSILLLLGKTIKKGDSITIKSLDYLGGKVTFVGEAAGQEAVNHLKENLLTGVGGKKVDVIETGPATTPGRIKFTISIS